VSGFAVSLVAMAVATAIIGTARPRVPSGHRYAIRRGTNLAGKHIDSAVAINSGRARPTAAIDDGDVGTVKRTLALWCRLDHAEIQNGLLTSVRQVKGLIVQCEGSISIFIACLVALSRPICFGLRVFLVQATLVTVTSALAPQHEVLLMEKVPTLPVHLERAADGGYLVLLDTNPNVLLKLDSAGKTVWSFEDHTVENARARFRRLSAEANGDVLLCTERDGGPQNSQALPSGMIRLNSQGREIARLDAQSTPIDGGAIYFISSCLTWGSGYVIVANQKRPSGAPDDYGKMSGFPFHTVVLRLRSDFTVEWRKAFAGLASPPGTPAAPKVLRSGDLIIPVVTGIFRIDPNGILKAQAKLGVCTWLRTINDDPRLRFACLRDASTSIVEYDESLNIKNEIPLYDNVGVPAVCELANGTFTLLANDSPKAPFVQIYSAQGKALDKYRFPTYASEGAVVDCLPISATEFVVLRNIDKDTFISVLTWMKAR
jgi:hypothetical protein